MSLRLVGINSIFGEIAYSVKNLHTGDVFNLSGNDFLAQVDRKQIENVVNTHTQLNTWDSLECTDGAFNSIPSHKNDYEYSILRKIVDGDRLVGYYVSDANGNTRAMKLIDVSSKSFMKKVYNAKLVNNSNNGRDFTYIAPVKGTFKTISNTVNNGTEDEMVSSLKSSIQGDIGVFSPYFMKNVYTNLLNNPDKPLTMAVSYKLADTASGKQKPLIYIENTERTRRIMLSIEERAIGRDLEVIVNVRDGWSEHSKESELLKLNMLRKVSEFKNNISTLVNMFSEKVYSAVIALMIMHDDVEDIKLSDYFAGIILTLTPHHKSPDTPKEVMDFENEVLTKMISNFNTSSVIQGIVKPKKDYPITQSYTSRKH